MVHNADPGIIDSYMNKMITFFFNFFMFVNTCNGIVYVKKNIEFDIGTKGCCTGGT